MARYDKLKVYNSGYKGIKEVRVYDGSKFVSLGLNDGSLSEVNKNKMFVYNGSGFVPVLYKKFYTPTDRRIEIGKDKNIKLSKTTADRERLNVDTYHSGYDLTMKVRINKTTPLYTVYTKNQGDIQNQAYVNYIAEVDGNRVRIRVTSHFSGYEIGTGRWVNGYSTNKVTKYKKNLVGKLITIKFHSSKNSGDIKVTLDGTEYNLGDVNTSWVYNPNKHRIGCKTKNKSGDLVTGGSAYLYEFSTTPVESRSSVFRFNVDNLSPGSSSYSITKNSYNGAIILKGTSVYQETKTEWKLDTL